MAVDCFVWFVTNPKSGMGEPKGETKDASFKSGGAGLNGDPNPAFEISTWSFAIENPTTIGSATSGAGGGKAKLNEFSVKKVVDSATPIFFKNAVAGAHYKKVTLAMRKSGGDASAAGKPFLTYTFYTVFTTGVEYDIGDEQGPTETIKFQYGTVVLKYQKQAADGTSDGSPVIAGWNQITNKAKSDEGAPDDT